MISITTIAVPIFDLFSLFVVLGSFAGKNKEVQSIALIILHPMMYQKYPGKRSQIHQIENEQYHHHPGANI
jgi:hypothetical protein